MGEYAPEDQRTVHANAGPKDSISDWHEREKTERERQHDQYEGKAGAQPGDQPQALHAQTGGPRPEYDQYEVNQAGTINTQASQDTGPDSEAQFEQDGDIPASPQEERIDAERAIPGEISDDIDERLAADANRPLGQS